VAPSNDVIVDGGPPARAAEGYEYVARRPLAVVALAEARGLSAPDVRAVVDHLADGLDACATEQGAKAGGAPPQGAARVVAEVGRDGGVSGVSLRIDPGSAAPALALLCLVAPIKLLSFPLAPDDAGGNRGLAIEALWGPTSPAP